jgi:probable HAF family extracellular repeat protein
VTYIVGCSTFAFKNAVSSMPNKVTLRPGISNLGMMVGFYIDTAGVYHGFIYQNGTYASFNDPNAGTKKGQGTQGSGIDDLGTIVGGYIDKTGKWNGFMELGGSYTTLDGPKPNQTGWLSYANCINDLGTVVGLYTDTRLELHGFLYRDGKYTTVNDPLAGSGGKLEGTVLDGINDLGVVTGITTATGKATA